jgi:hypothetical protein
MVEAISGCATTAGLGNSAIANVKYPSEHGNPEVVRYIGIILEQVSGQLPVTSRRVRRIERGV